MINVLKSILSKRSNEVQVVVSQKPHDIFKQVYFKFRDFRASSNTDSDRSYTGSKRQTIKMVGQSKRGWWRINV